MSRSLNLNLQKIELSLWSNLLLETHLPLLRKQLWLIIRVTSLAEIVLKKEVATLPKPQVATLLYAAQNVAINVPYKTLCSCQQTYPRKSVKKFKSMKVRSYRQTFSSINKYLKNQEFV